jgi:ubiquinone/menaquinone biosynthesis C-methylase UbiE
MVEQMRLASNARVLDVGCGMGTEAREIALAATVEVVGVDDSRAMIDEAVRRSAGTGLPVSFRVADATRLPFRDAHFDACQALTLLEHVTDPTSVISEMVRVTRPGGRIAVLDLDQGSTLMDHPDRAMTRTILQAWTDGFAGGWNGRRLRRLLRQALLTDVTLDLVATEFSSTFMAQVLTPTTRRLLQDCGVDAARLDRWRAQLQELTESDTFTAVATWFLAAGTIPD